MRIIVMALLTLFSYPLFSHVQQFNLDNGLKILVKEDHRAPVAVTMVWYNIGSADEPGGITGVSHALEHLMFKGTQKYPAGFFSKKIAVLGGQDNAFTNSDYTAYFEKIATQNLATTFELEADRMQHLVFDEKEFNKEMHVIEEERRLRIDNNPQALAFERFLATAHLSPPYQHPVIGWMSDIKHMQVADAKTWYRRFYTPNNATLVVVGDVSPDRVLALAKQYFGPLKKRPILSRKPQIEPRALGKKTVTIHAVAKLPMLMLGFTVPTVKTTPDHNKKAPYALELIAGILDAGDNARFTKNLVRKKQVASSIDAYYNLYARYQTQFILYGTPSQDHTVEELKKNILLELAHLQTTPISNSELQRIKTQIIAQKTFEKDSIFGQAMEIGLLETIGLGWQTADHYIEHINTVTPKDIQDTAKLYFQEKNRTDALLIPTMTEHEKKL